MKRWRIALATAGILLVLFGVFRLVTQIPLGSLILLAGWLIGAVVIHDGVLSPLVLGVGMLVSRVPPRARGPVQAALVIAGIVTSIAIPLIARRNSQPPAKALLLRNYAGNLGLLLALTAVGSLGHYAVRVARRSRPTGR